ncbi:hypothetical protein KI912_003108 [Salmonella enterica]|nr:hypothetical protein [Salmonella enterica]
MAYQTGTMKNTQDLVSQLVTLMKTQGWHLDKQTADMGGAYWYVHHPDVGYFVFNTSSGNSLILYGTTGFDGSKPALEQPGATRDLNMYLGARGSSLVSYDFFVTSRYAHVVVQGEGDHFYHFGVGILNKEGTWSGGQYVYGGSGSGFFPFDHHSMYGSNSLLRAEIPGETGITDGWYTFYQTPPRAMGPGNPMVNGEHPDLLAVETSQSALGGVLAPVPCAIYLTTSQKVTLRPGVVPDFCLCRMAGLTPRARLQINGEPWMVIPINRLTFRRPTSWDQGDTFSYAYAYRVIS